MPRTRPRRIDSAHRIIPRTLLSLLLSFVALWAYLQIDTRTLWGLRVRGELLPRTKTPEQTLERIADAWASEEVSIVTGVHLTRAKRAELGGRLDTAAVAKVLRALGHSGNPFIDLWTAADAAIGGRAVIWAPRIDRIKLGRYVRAVRNIVEIPPVAGTRGEGDWSIAGSPGTTLDTMEAVEALERALRHDTLHLEIAMREVRAPEAVAIGAPDAFLYSDEGEEPLLATGAPEVDQALMRAARPRAFMPNRGCEPMDPPYQQHCQGPRRVAMPFGPEAELADRLELGTLQTVARLLYYAPRADWVSAAGGPVTRHMDMLWPTPGGRLWRRFGYVRHPPFESLLHRGIDIGAARGAPLVAVNNGIVAYSDNNVRGYGNLLVVVHDDGGVTFSAHCAAIYVFAGQRVRRGQIVGEVGDTGLARGVHVHWEYHQHGKATDPNGMFSGAN